MARSTTILVQPGLTVEASQEPPYGDDYRAQLDAAFAESENGMYPADRDLPQPGPITIRLLTATSSDPVLDQEATGALIRALVDPFGDLAEPDDPAPADA